MPRICRWHSYFTSATMKDVPAQADSQSMERSRDLVILIDSLGQSLQLTTQLWKEVLRIAEANGWQPAGTEPPPRDWGLAAPLEAAQPWDGNFSEPRGQLVTPADAFSLAAALDDAPGLAPEMCAVAGFCLHGSFIICPLSPELDAYLNGGLQLARQSRRILNAGSPSTAPRRMPERVK